VNNFAKKMMLATTLAINPIIPEIICFKKRLYLNHSPYALREQKNRKLSKKYNNGCIA